MGQFVIDSNAVIDYLSGNLPESGMKYMDNAINSIPLVSIMTKIEVLGFNNSEKDAELLNEFVSSSIIIELTEEITDYTIQLRKDYKIKVPDAIIAATAIILDLPLITRDIHDFKSVSGLQLINPWEIK